MVNIMPNSEAIKQMIEKLKPIIGDDTANKYWLIWNLEDEDGKKQLQEMLNLQYLKLFGSTNISEPAFIPIPATEAEGNFHIGDVVYMGMRLYPLKLRASELPMHAGIFGRSGSGKSNTLFCLLTSLLKNNIHNTKVLAFDFKRELRSIISDKLGENIKIYTVGRNDIVPFCFNPLIPPTPETSPNNWMDSLLEILCKAFFIGDGAMDVLKRGISSCYKDFGVYSNQKVKTYPTFKDVYEKIENLEARGRQGDWKSSALRVLRALSFGELGKALNTPFPAHLEAILSDHCIFELDSLSSDKKSFFTAALLLWVYNYELEKFSKGKKPEGLQRLIIVDEAHNVYPRHEGKETVMENMLRQARFLGCGIVLSDQCPSEMSPIALANTMIHINLNQKNKADINAAASNLLLDQEQREHLGHLKLGEALVRIAGRYTHPFLISIPAVTIKENSVTDSMVKAHMEGLISSDCYSAYSHPNSQKNDGIEPIPLQHKEEELTEQEKKFMEDIINNPYSSISGRYKRLNISARKGNILKQILLNKGIIETEDIIDGNSRLLLSKLSKKGEAEIKKLGYNIEKLNGKAGLEHEYWRHKIADNLETLGYQIKMEEPVNGETDIVAILPDPSGKEPVKLAIEIETGKHGPDLIIKNIQKNLKAGFTRIISAITSREVLKNIAAKLKEEKLEDIDGIKVLLAEDFCA